MFARTLAVLACFAFACALSALPASSEEEEPIPAPDPDSDRGVLVLGLMDGPYAYDELSELRIAFDELALARSSGDEDPVLLKEGGGVPQAVDILTLAGGRIEELARVELPAGAYQELRVKLAPDLCQVTMSAGARHWIFLPGDDSLRLPEGGGFVIEMGTRPLVVEAGKTAEYLIDLDIAGSLHPVPIGAEVGDILYFDFRPALRIFDPHRTSRILGQVMADPATPGTAADDRPLRGATVSAWRDGKRAASAMTAPDGRFEILGLEEGLHILGFERRGYGRVRLEARAEPETTQHYNVTLRRELRPGTDRVPDEIQRYEEY